MLEKLKTHLLIYTDGACSGNPGPGGWGAVLATPDGTVRELGGGKKETTNNEMELSAIIEALKVITHDPRPVLFFTDSTYAIRGITQWIWGWRNRNWTTAEGNPVANRESWEKLLRLVTGRNQNGGKIEWHYSRGHVGTPGNERCDQIAVAFSQGRWIELFQGSLLNYPVAIHDLPEETALPEMKPKTEKKLAYSYLSKIGSTVYRHMDWNSCERRVKGQSGALFKKCMSEAEEAAVLKSWGLSEGHPILE